MISTVLACVLQLALAASGGGPPRDGNYPSDLILEVAPPIVLHDQDIRAVVRIRPDTANRSLTIAMDGVFYSSTERSLDGDRAPRTHEFYFRKLPAGEYVLQVQVADVAGHVRKAERRITVIGDDQVVELARRRR
jgi:hypothetical protein